MPSLSPPDREDRRYWRSLDRLLDSPAVRDAVANDLEFAPGADLPPDGVTRRTMMSLMGASFALAGTTACRKPVQHIVPYVEAPEHVIPGVPRHYATTYTQGSQAYGVVVESHDGRPTKLEGNSLHPASGGAATPWMQASVLDLYDPDRARTVSHQGSATSWQAFLDSWTERQGELAGGSRLAFLVDGHASPTVARLAGELRSRHPGMRWVTWEPLGESNSLAALGQRVVHHLDRARRVLSLGADFLHTERDSLIATRGFTTARRRGGEAMLRLYVAEPSVTVTGANADHRIRLRARDLPAFADAVAAVLGVEGGEGTSGGDVALPAELRRQAELVAADLRSAGAEALVVAGAALPPAVHRRVMAINRSLGAVGTTVELHPIAELGWGRPGELRALVAAIAAGEVDTLVILGGNPLYTGPADLDLAAALATVPNSIHLSPWRDETSAACTWHLPQSHYLEAWGDARSADGTASLLQPLIAPLHDTRSTVEVLALLAGDDRSADQLVRETWPALDDAGWRKALHDGVVSTASPVAELPGLASGVVVASAEPAAGTATAPGAPVVAPAPANAAVGEPDGEETIPAADGLEITFPPSRSTYDGRFANNAWLQELPDAITKIVWDNAALVSPATAAEHGVENGDLIELRLRGRSVQAPIFVLPGQADGSIALALGYGRQAAGRVGDGVGADAYRLRTSTALGADWGVELVKVGRHELVQTQEHGAMEGRDLVRETLHVPDVAAASGVAHGAAAHETEDHGGADHGEADHGEADHGDEDHGEADHVEGDHDEAGAAHGNDHQLFPDHDYSSGYQWAMAIDLASCTGCNACVIACQAENNIPVVGKAQVAKGREMHWLRVDRYFAGAEAEPTLVFQPIPCMHCENAPCEQVCPVAATVHDSEGLNSMIYNRCIGTRYCSNNCPYKVRRFNFFNFTKDTPELLAMLHNPDVTVRSRGVMEKCTYCVQRISEKKIVAKSQGRRVLDGEIKTACQETCPADAIVFGDLNDKGSEVVRRKASERDYTLLAELNNRPRTSYQAGLRYPNPAWPESGGMR